MVSNEDEVVDIAEYAYAFEYIYNHGPNTSVPKFRSDCDMLLCNYGDFDCTKGVAEYFDKVIVCKTRVDQVRVRNAVKKGLQRIDKMGKIMYNLTDMYK